MFKDLFFSRESLILAAGVLALFALFALLYLRSFGKIFPNRFSTPSMRGGVLGTVAAAAACVVFGGYVITAHVGHFARLSLVNQGEMYASALCLSIQGELTKIDEAVGAMSGSPWVVTAFDGTPESLDRTNLVLDRYCRAMGASVCYLLDTAGTTVASSNRASPLSFVGKNYGFRTYFQAARAGQHFHDFALGVTTAVRGYYASAPVFGSDHHVAGVAVIKQNVNTLEAMFRQLPESFLVDKNGIVFMASDSMQVFRALLPVPDELKEQIGASRQFGTVRFEPIVESMDRKNDVLFRGVPHLVTQHAVGETEWSVVVFLSLARVVRDRMIGVSITLLLLAVLMSIMLPAAWYRTRGWIRSIVRSEERFRAVFENAPDGILMIDPSGGQVLDINPLAASWFDIDPKKIGPCVFADFVESPVDRLRAPTGPFTCDLVDGTYRVRNGSGSGRELSITSAEITLFEQPAWLLFARDISGLLLAQRELELSESKYRELTEQLPETVFEIDATRRLLFVNRSGLERFGYDRAHASEIADVLSLVAPHDRERVAANIVKIMAGETTEYHEYQVLCRDGTLVPVIINSCRILDAGGKPVGLRGLIIDISERKRLELEMQRVDKLHSLGVLAGGLAHDFNNLLTAIWSGLFLVKYSAGENPLVTETLADLEKAVERGKDLTMQLLTYAKGGAPVKSAASIREIIDQTSRFVLSGLSTVLVVNEPENLLSVDVDSGQVSQVLQNLFLNASQAMDNGGTIEVSLANRLITLSDTSAVAPGRYVEMKVRDTGKGIDPEILGRVFDPFYTTKTGGSGLGLATSLSIVNRHGGSLSVDSVPGKETIFTVLLPSTTEPITLPKKESVICHGRGRVLIMDDDRTVRVMGEKLLEHLGYRATAVASGQDAIEAYRVALDRGDRYDAVIVDLTVPGGMGGQDAVKELLALDSQAVVLVSSGYSEDRVMAQFREYGFKGVIRKPYSIKELGEIVGKALGNDTPG